MYNAIATFVVDAYNQFWSRYPVRLESDYRLVIPLPGTKTYQVPRSDYSLSVIRIEVAVFPHAVSVVTMQVRYQISNCIRLFLLNITNAISYYLVLLRQSVLDFLFCL